MTSPALAYGDSAVLLRAIPAIVRQLREINQLIAWQRGEQDTHGQSAQGRTDECDRLLAEIGRIVIGATE